MLSKDWKTVCSRTPRGTTPRTCSRPGLAVLATLLACASLAGLGASTASAARSIPVGAANVNDQNLRDRNWLYALRFVLDRDTTIYRFLSGFKGQGAGGVFSGQGGSCSGPGSGCYGAGNGGSVNARLVTVNADGTPNLGNVLAQETASAQERYASSKSTFGVGGITQMWFWNMGGVTVKANTMYAMVYRNVDANPGSNFVSTNSPDMKDSEVGPNGRNNLDPNAPGAIGGLDAREAVAWSRDNGLTWTWGREVGPYFGDASSDDGTRIPWYGWQTSSADRVHSNQPYYNYWVNVLRTARSR